MKPRICLIALLLLTGAAPAWAGTSYSWNNPAGGLWNVAANWSPNTGFPGSGSGDTATISLPGTYIVTNNATPTIAGLTVGGSSGTQTLTNITSMVLNGAGTVTANGVLGFNSLTLSGTGSLEANGPLAFNGVTITLAGGITANDTLVLSDNTQLNGASVMLVNNGTATFNSPTYIEVYNGATLSNGPSGTFNWTVSGSSQVLNSGAGCLFVNTGILNFSAPSGDTGIIGTLFTNSGAGVVNVNGGTLSLNGGGADSSSSATGFDVASGATLETAGNYTFNAGTTIKEQSPGGNLSVSGGTANFNGTVSLSGTYTISSGVANFTGAYDIAGSSALLITGGTAIFSGGSGTVAPASMTLTGTLGGNVPVTVSGAITFNGGTITNTGGVTANGTIVFSDNPQLNGASVMLVNNGTATFNSPTYIEVYNGATLSNGPSGTFNWTVSGSSQVLNSGAGCLFVNTGILNFSAPSGDTGIIGTLFTNSGAGVVNVNGGTLSLNGGGADSSSSATGFDVASGATLETAGNYTFNAGTTIKEQSPGGNLSVSGGTANFNGTVSLSGTYTISSGVANFTGAYDIAGSSALLITGGTAIFSGGSGTVAPASMTLTGTLGGNVPVTVSGAMTFSGGTITNIGGVFANGTLSFSSNPQINGAGALLVNKGTATFGSPTYIEVYNGATLSNAPSGIFNWTVSGSSQVLNSGAGCLFVNTGILNFSAPSGDTGIIGTLFTNSGAGVVNVNGGTLSLNGGGADSSSSATGFDVASGATLETAGNYTFNAGTTIKEQSPGGNLSVSGGTANFNGTVSLSGTYTISSGVANFTGAYDIAGSSALLITGGTAIFSGGSGTVAPASMTLTGTLGGNVPVTVSGAMTFSGGTITNIGGVFANGTLSFSSNPQINGAGALLVNKGTATFGSPTYIEVYNGATLSNAPSGIFNWTVSGSSQVLNSGAGCLFVNTGILNFTAPSINTGTIATLFNNSGSGVVNVNGGTLSLNGGGVDSSSSATDFDVASGATLETAGNYTFNPGTTVEGSGTLDVNSGTTRLNGAVTVTTINVSGTAICGAAGSFTWNTLDLSGTLGGATPVIVSGTFTFNGGTITNNGGVFANGTLSFSDNAEINGVGVLLVNNGTATFGSPTYIEVYNGATLSNGPSGTFNWTVSGSSQVLNSGAGCLFVNTGILNFSAPSGDTGIIGTLFTNSGSGVVNVNGGTLSLNGGGVDSSSSATDFDVASGATLETAGNYTFNPGTTVEGSGTLDVNSGTTRLNGAVTVTTINVSGTAICGAAGSFTWNTLDLSGTLGGATPVIVSGTFTFNGGTITNNGGVFANGILNFSDNAEINGVGVLLVNNGTANFTSPTYIEVLNSATLSNSPSGIFNWAISGSSEILASGSIGLFANAGVVNFSAPSGATGTIATMFTNSGSGIVNVNGGTLDCTGVHGLTSGTLDFGITNLSTFGTATLSGAANLTGTLAATFLNSSFSPVIGNTWQVLNYGSQAGIFTKTNLPPTAVWQTTYNAANATIKILQFVPTITWPTPSSIVYGTALSSVQLNATAVSPYPSSAVLTGPGTFTYALQPSGTPISSGTILNASNQTLAVVFTPSVADQGNFSKATNTVNIDVLPRPVALTGTRTYDGTTNAASTILTIGNIVGSDVVSVASGSGGLAGASVGPEAITSSGTLALGGAQAPNYTLTGLSGSVSITAKPLTMSGLSVPPSKIYDGTTVAAISGSPGSLQSAEADGTGSTSDGKPYTGDAVSLTGTATGTYSGKDVGTAISVTFGGVSLTGAQANDYTLTIESPALAAITTKDLTMTGLSVAPSKVYDGTTAAAISGSPGSLQTAEADGTGSTSDGKPYTGDAVSLTGIATGTYNSKDVAAATTVTFGGVSLGGAQAGDYTLTIESPVAAAITQKALTMSGLSVPSSKIYDGTTIAAVSGSPGSLQSAEADGTGSAGDGKPYTGDAVSLTGPATGTYNSKDVAAATTVTFGGVSLGGAQAGDYTLTLQSPVAATITEKTLTMSGLSVPSSKVYDGTTAAVVSGSPGSLESPETGGSGSTSDGKPYIGDAVSLSGPATGTYNSKDVATATSVTFAGVSLTGVQEGDYTLTIESPAAATITPATLTITADNESKIAGQTFNLGTTAFTEIGLISGDTVTGVTLTSAGAASSAAAGGYPIVPSDAVGTGLANYTISYENGTLTVTSGNCDPPPSGLVSWWKAEGNAIDNIGGNNGALENGVTYVAGEVGQAFDFNADSAMVVVGTPANLQLQNFTIEAWVQRGSATAVSSDPAAVDGNALLFGYGTQGYGFGMTSSGNLLLTKIDVSSLSSSVSVTDTAFHHVAVTESGGTVVFYVDGAPYPVGSTYAPGFAFTKPAAIGGRADNLNVGNNDSFLGAIDEMSIYDRALTTLEITNIYNAGSAGKCLPALEVTWATPSDIVYGTPLSGVQLDATANIPGTFTYTPPAGTVLPAGQNQQLSVTFSPSDTADYSPSVQTVSINVDQAPLTITASPQGKTYGAVLNLGATAFTTTVLSNSDTVSGVTLSSPGAAGTAAVGGYLITPSLAVGTGLANYNITYDTGALTVTAAPLTITAGPQSKTYGAILNLGTTAFTTTVLSNSDTVAGVTLASPGVAGTAAVGGYLITPSLAIGTGLANYNITYDTGPLTVTPAPLTVTATAQSKTYGAVLNLGTTAFTTTVLSNSDSVTGATLSSPGAVGTAAVGGYSITPSAAVGTGLANYNIMYDTGTLTVTTAPLTITASPQSKTFGTTLNLGTTAFTTTVLSNSDTVTGVTLSSPGAASTAADGQYPITPSAAVGTGLGNYDIFYQMGTLTVSSSTAGASITCPDTITVNQATGECSQLVAFAPVVTGTPTPTLVCTLDGNPITSPYNFPVGTNTVQCTATNSTGSDSCSFTVIVVDTNPPVAGLNSLGTYQSQTASVAVAKVLLRDTAPSGGTLSIPSVSPATPNGGTVSLGGGLITYSPPASLVGPDSITYTLSDGCGTTQGTIAVIVLATNLPANNRVSIAQTELGTTVIFAGVPGATYQIQSAITVSGPWGNIGNPIQAAANGLVQYTDTTSAAPTQFYRTQYVSGP